MNILRKTSILFSFAFLVIFILFPVAAKAQELEINGLYSVDKVNQGRTIQAAIVANIPKGLYVIGNKSPSKFVTSATLKVDAERGIKVGAVSYPRATARTFKFSETQLTVYENRLIIRFNITVPANFALGVTTIRLRFQYQTCSEQICNSPSTRDISMPITVVNSSEPIKRINGQIFANGN